MDEVSCQYYLRVAHSNALPIAIFSRLLQEFGSVNALAQLSRPALLSFGLNDEQVDILSGAVVTSGCKEQLAATMEWSKSSHNHLLCYESQHYPALLREIDSPPPILYVRGAIKILNERMLAVVGSRSASNYGKRNAYWISRELARVGLHISSGMANGIDTQAHTGALAGLGKTIAVVGTGIDRVYPARNAALAEQIAENGVLVSEFPLGTPPYASNFPRRNRIISGMSQGTLVVEGNIKSGSLITARLAMEQNRDVFALPGPIGSSGSRGCHHLIKQGAKLVEAPVDILEELGIEERQQECSAAHEALSKQEAKKLTAKQASVLNAIEEVGCLFETIQGESRLGLQELNTELISLEAAGLIHQKGGRYFRD